MNILKTTDVLIVGSGTAGLTAALQLADTYQVSVVCKSRLGEGSSVYAQGGIAAVMDKNDSYESHIEDTIISGDGLCNKKSVSFVINNAQSCIKWLISKGINFTLDPGFSKFYHLMLESGHSCRRILHTADATGKEIQNKLSRLVKNHPNILVYEYCNVIDLILYHKRCIGAYVLELATTSIKSLSARVVVLASGGASGVYQHSTNPIGSNGDGIAIAYRAGCRVANLEFNQFHPTCLYNPGNSTLLLSEVLRGEGAYLRLPSGRRFMTGIDKRLELASRDILARSITYQMSKHSIEHIYLDMTHKSKEFIIKNFPTIYGNLQKYGFNLAEDQIPVVPAAHYTCGGVMVNQQANTDITGLYAIGEVAYTGLHGANRMASNSLLECLVYASSAAKDIRIKLPGLNVVKSLQNYHKIISNSSSSIHEYFIHDISNKIRSCMSKFMGTIRSNNLLKQGKHRVNTLHQEILKYCSECDLTVGLINLKNLTLVAELMIDSAILRRESRGLHFNLDYKGKSEHFLNPTVLHPASDVN